MNEDDKYYKELFYNDIMKKIKYRKPFNPDNNIVFNNSKLPIYFKTKGYLMNEDNEVFFNKPVTFLEAIQAWALLPKTKPLAFQLFKTEDSNVVINLPEQVNFSVYQRAIPGLGYTDGALKKLDVNNIDIEFHEEYPFEVIPEEQVHYDVHSSNISIGTVKVDKNHGFIEVSSLLGSWNAVAFKGKNIAQESFDLLKPPYYDYIVGLFKGEIKDAKATLSSYPVKFSTNIKEILKAVTAKTLLQDVERG